MLSLGKEAQRLRDETEASRLSPDEIDRMRQAMLERVERTAVPAPRRRLWLALLGLGCMATATAAIVLIIMWHGTTTPPDAGFAVIAGEECLETSSDALTAQGACITVPRVRLGRAELTLAPGSRIAREGDAVRVRHGQVGFVVEHRVAGQSERETPFVVEVSAGAILVKGTRFTVVQEDLGGEVSVSEGKILFRWNDGADSEAVSAGGVLRWPREAISPPRTSPPAEQPRDASTRGPTNRTKIGPPPGGDRPASPRESAPTSASGPDAQQVMQRLFQLRSQKLYDEAQDLLKSASRDPGFSQVQRERFSYELGVLLAQVRGANAACEHWRAHVVDFPESPRAEEVQLLLRNCPPPR